MNAESSFPEFTGREALLKLIDYSLAAPSDTELTDRMRHGLSDLIRNKTVFLPTCVFEPVEGHYARRELYACAERGTSVVAMTWAPGQGTPIHDHCGLWCVEGVWQGNLEIVRYELEEDQNERVRFTQHETIMAGTGSSGALIPPHEYHTIRNPNQDQIAVSLHIYKSAMNNCTSFEQVDGEWYRRVAKNLCLDDVRCD